MLGWEVDQASHKKMNGELKCLQLFSIFWYKNNISALILKKVHFKFAFPLTAMSQVTVSDSEQRKGSYSRSWL